jgi:hypothetical protein
MVGTIWLENLEGGTMELMANPEQIKQTIDRSVKLIIQSKLQGGPVLRLRLEQSDYSCSSCRYLCLASVSLERNMLLRFCILLLKMVEKL